ncbi:MAG: CoA transferase [Dehalococcoidia bacterium]|nr:CoA transferase [Dehalococcoidia bacterium]
MVRGSLASLKVLEYSEHISGPYCTKMMADLGAEVIKVEPPFRGDRARRLGPFPGGVPHPEQSGLFLYLNTNKLGVTLDPGKATGRDMFLSLLAEADVFVQNYSQKVMADLGLDYETLRQVNPRLVMVSISPLGGTGPYKDFNCYPINSAAASSVMNQIGYPDREPLMPPEDQMSYQGAIHGAAATLVAVWEQRRRGRGQHVDVSEAECLGNMLVGRELTNYVYRGVVGFRGGYRFITWYYPYAVLPCEDGFMSVIAVEDHQWDRFAVASGNPEWGTDPRFAIRFERGKRRDELDEMIAPWLMTHTKEEIFDLCRANRIPFAPINSIADLLNSDHLRERDYFEEVDHPATGRLTYPGAPYKLAKTPWEIRSPAPGLGEHNEEIFCRRLGYSRGDLASLRAVEII